MLQRFVVEIKRRELIVVPYAVIFILVRNSLILYRLVLLTIELHGAKVEAIVGARVVSIC
jgi:hypothetical protein